LNRVYVVLVNWNGWADTIECLETLMRSDYPDYRVIVCDNRSADGSVSRIKAWAEGRLALRIPLEHPLRKLSHPPIPKPVSYSIRRRGEAESGGKRERDIPALTVIENGANLGFAGANNVAIRYALARDDVDYFWFLNNDTVVKPDALTHLVRKARRTPGAGICGSTIAFYHAPQMISARGGAAYNMWFGLSFPLGRLQPLESEVDARNTERAFDYVVGASMLVSRSFIEDVGLMNEEYFLYYEELDWAMRARGRYSLAYAPRSVIYHKEGAAAKTLNRRSKRRRAESFLLKSKLRFTWKFAPAALPTVLLQSLLDLAKR